MARELGTAFRPRVLDVGCGHGYIHRYLRSFGYRITAVEVADELLIAARQANPDIAYVCSAGEVLPFGPGSFDVAVAICVLHHVTPGRWATLVTEMKSVLRPGGIAVIFEHNPLNPLTRYVVASNEIDADAVLLSHWTARKLLETAGFEKVKSRHILFTPFSSGLFRRLDSVLGGVPLGAQYYVVGRIGSESPASEL